MLLQTVFNYIKANPASTTVQVAEALEMDAADVGAMICELRARGAVSETMMSLSHCDNYSHYSALIDAFNDPSEYCVCKTSRSVTSDVDSSEFGYWDTCCVCGKHLEDGFHFYNHYDGEDHDEMSDD